LLGMLLHRHAADLADDRVPADAPLSG
jgi:hypothetical protein